MHDLDGQGVLHPSGQYPETHTHLHPLHINPTARKLGETNTLSEAHGGEGGMSQIHSKSQTLRVTESSSHGILNV